MDFIHLHNHTDYSLLDGAITIKSLVKQAKAFGMPAVAMTDHGNMFGAIEFYQTAIKEGIKPIVGQEFYVAPASRFDRKTDGDKSYHLVLLARNLAGYKNLMILSSAGFTEGFYYKPRIDIELLRKHSDGLICLTACLAGEIPRMIVRGQMAEARAKAKELQEIFGEDYLFLEIQDHGIPEQKIVIDELVKMSSELGIPLIATNDCHYLRKEDAFNHEVLLCVQTRKTLSDTDRMRFDSSEFYFKSGEEMERLFGNLPDALTNTSRVADMVDLHLDLGQAILPNFEVPDGFDLNTYLRHLVIEGAKINYGDPLPPHIIERIDYELSVIIKMDFAGYFLITWDFIKYAKSHDIPVGPGRGSAAGSIVAYSLGITMLDPLKYNLLFERFLNPDRNEMPDIDIDFCSEKRELVIDYVKQKYGYDHVSQIITYNKMMAKAVVKDVARAMDIPFDEANRISKLITEKTLKESLESSKELKEFYDSSENAHKLIDISLSLEGLNRSAGKHAAGVVISKGPLTDYVPLYKDSDGNITSQYDKVTLEQAGLVKMDFLALKNLTIIEACLHLIKENRGVTLDINKIPFDDPAVYDLLKNGDTKGVFQLESTGMQNLLRRLGPTDFEDIIAVVALYRPGPLNSGMADDFIERKKHPEKIAYPLDILEPVLKDTLGVIIYQEQVMFISQIMGGFSMPEADKLRKAMGKKKMDLIRDMEGKFLKGAEKKKIDIEIAKKVYDDMSKFGEYGFNKSHSAAYAYVTYQTAYLKKHFRLEYMTALLTFSLTDQDDIIQYVNECRSNNIKILPPDIRYSYRSFTIEGDSIRFGLGAVKGVGDKAIETIIQAREKSDNFKSIKSFLEYADISTLNKGVLESLIKSGAFDAFNPNRAQMMSSIDNLLNTARQLQKDKASGQGSLFGIGAEDSGGSFNLDLIDAPQWPENIRLAFEKEILGLYLSGHPLAKYEKEITAYACDSIIDIHKRAEEVEDGQFEVTVVGLLSSVAIRQSKRGNQFASFIIETLEGSIEGLLFSRAFTKYKDFLTLKEPFMLKGKVEAEEGKAGKIIVDEIKPLRQARSEAISAVHIKVVPPGFNEDLMNKIKEVMADNRGSCPIYFHVYEKKDHEVIIKAHTAFNISPSEKCLTALADTIGKEYLRYSIGNG